MNHRNGYKNKCSQVVSRIVHSCVLCALLVVFSPYAVHSQPVKCVTVEGTSFMDGLSPVQAKEQALENARKKALYTAIANDISIDALEIAMEIEGDIQGAIPYGEITRETIISEGQITEPKANNVQSQRYQVKLEACCQAQKKKKPEFAITASLDGNNHSFKPGDTLILNIRPSHDCYIYLFNLLKGEDEDQVLRWFPNKHDNQNFVKADETLVFPRSENMKIRLALPEGEDRVTDYIYILALKAPSDMKQSSVMEGLKDEYGGKPSKMRDFISDLVTVPFSQRAEVLLKYRIVK